MKNEILSEILNFIEDGIIVTNYLYNIIFANNKAQYDITNITNNVNLININIMDIFNELKNVLKDDCIFKNKKIKINASKIIYGDMLYSSLSDVEMNMTFNVTINTIQKNNEAYHMFTLINIHNNQIITNEKQTIDIKKKQNNFIAFLSHELRNPLQTIILSNYLLNKELKKIPDINTKINNHLSIMEKSCNDMRKIISDILDLSKIEASEMSIDINKCTIKQLINDLILIHSKDFEIECFFSENLPTILYTDEIRLNQILVNLLTNAIKYTTNNINKVKIDIALDNNYILFKVIDNGIGIKEEEIGNIFNEFSKTSNNQNIACNSNGLGLCISQKMANLLNGFISVKSEYQKGSIFTLHHPIHLNNKQETDLLVDNVTDIRGKILLVDDNNSNLSLLKMLMEHFNYEMGYDLEVHAVNSGYEAIKICQINNYNLIFMDINMTGMDGCTACRMIKQEHQTIVIATTGNILAKQTELNEKYACFDDVLIKPYDNNMVLNVIKKYLS